MRSVAIRVLRQKDCTSIIRNARRRLDNYERYTNFRQLVELDTGQKATGVLCYNCRELIRIGEEYVKKIGRGGGPYHPLCAKKLNIL